MTSIWQELVPDRIFQAVEKVTQTPLSNICLRRNSYINRVYELEPLDGQARVIAKFYRPGRWSSAMIEEEHQFLLELAAQEIPVVPPLTFNNQTLFLDGPFPFALFPKKGGRAMNEFDQETWKIVGRLSARIHSIGAKPHAANRLLWEPASATRHHLDLILHTEYLLPDFRPAFLRTVESFIKTTTPFFKDQEKILLHGDSHRGNLIVRPGEGIFIVDFDDLCFGAPVQDFWMLLPGRLEHSTEELAWFLEGYETFRHFDRETLKLIPALRGMRIIHYLAWLATQCQEPDFHHHFPEAGTPRYWNETIRELQAILNDEILPT